MIEKPLHVQVAEALTGEPTCECGEAVDGYDQKSGLCKRCGWRPAPRYDTDWAVTGPLIEKYVDGFCFNLGAMGWCDHYQVSAFGGRLGRDIGWHQVRGETPLLAVCVLILTLKAKGKL